MSETLVNNTYYKYFKTLITLLLVINCIANNINTGNNTTLSHISFIAMMLIFILGIAFDIINFNRISDYIYLLFLLCFLILFKFNYFSFMLVSLALSFFFIRASDVLFVYKKIIVFQLIFGFLASLIGLSPLRNFQTGALTFGFVNENGTGMLLSILALSLFFRQQNNKLVFNAKFYNFTFLVLTISIEVFLFNDNTAVLMILLFFALIVAKKYLTRNKILYLIVAIIPVFLAFFAFFVAFNYTITSSTWINKLNSLITWRIDTWHYYLANYPLNYFANNRIINNKILFGYFDGTYTYLGIFNGLAMLIFIVVGLSLANIKLLYSKNYYLLIFLISFEFCGFAENVVINYNQSFALIFVMLAYSVNWLKEKD